MTPLRRSERIKELAKRRPAPTGIVKPPRRQVHRYALSATAIKTLPALHNINKLGMASFEKLKRGARWPEGTIKVTIEVSRDLDWLEFGHELKVGDAGDDGLGWSGKEAGRDFYRDMLDGYLSGLEDAEDEDDEEEDEDEEVKDQEDEYQEEAEDEAEYEDEDEDEEKEEEEKEEEEQEEGGDADDEKEDDEEDDEEEYY
jgi:hypothetical protein